MAPFIGAAIITSGTFLLTLFTLEESLPEDERTTSTQRQRSLPSLSVLTGNKNLTLILGVSFVASLAFSVLPATFSLYADRVLFSDRPAGTGAEFYIGLMLTFNGIVTVITQVALLKPLVDRFRERKVLLIGEIALMIAFFGLGLSANPIVVTLLLAPFAFGQGVSQPNMQALITRVGLDKSRGQMLGYYQSSRSLALILGPIWGGYAFEAISARAVYQIGGFIMILAIALAVLLLRQDLPPIGLDGGSGEAPA